MHTFLDEATIYIKAGDGGAGSVHFRREKFVPNGGPDGGDGGNGGSVSLKADSSLNTLFAFKRQRRFHADNGQAGADQRKHGRSAEDLIIPVPVGTIVRETENGEVLADLRRHGDTVVVARGGKGGLGNVHFKSSTHQAPGFAEKGEPGTERWLELELKVIADAGLIGLPNAGKSTLLSVISSARPKIADYPFTTLTPNLGVVEAYDWTFVVADIPGLIEGAHEGIGLGHDFLRHIERTLVLVHLVDGSAPDALEGFHQILRELALYDEELREKAQIVVINKLDIEEARERYPELKSELEKLGYEVFPLSAATREGLDALIARMYELIQERWVQKAELENAEEPQVINVAPHPDRFEIVRHRKTFHVNGESVERLAVMTDLESEEAVLRLQRRLKRLGVFNALQRAGVEEGGRVQIGSVDFVWDTSYEPEIRPGSAVAVDEES